MNDLEPQAWMGPNIRCKECRINLHLPKYPRCYECTRKIKWERDMQIIDELNKEKHEPTT